MTIRREVCEFDEPIGSWEAEIWTRVTVDGEVQRWVPHDEYGELPDTSAASGEIKESLEQKYQEVIYG